MSRDIHFNLFSQQSCSGKKEHWAGLTEKKRPFLLMFITSINALLEVLWEVEGNSSFLFIQVVADNNCQLQQDEKEIQRSWENSIFIGVSIKWGLIYWESDGIINIGRHAWPHMQEFSLCFLIWGQRSSTWHSCISNLVWNRFVTMKTFHLRQILNYSTGKVDRRSDLSVTWDCFCWTLKCSACILSRLLGGGRMSFTFMDILPYSERRGVLLPSKWKRYVLFIFALAAI